MQQFIYVNSVSATQISRFFFYTNSSCPQCLLTVYMYLALCLFDLVNTASPATSVPLGHTIPGILIFIKGKIEKVPRGIRGEKSSKDMASSRNLVSTIGILASPKMGDGTRCPEG